MALHRHDDWRPLVGEDVEIRQGGHLLAAGRVDAVSPDNSALWLHPGVPQPRMMVERSPGTEAWVNFRWDRP